MATTSADSRDDTTRSGVGNGVLVVSLDFELYWGLRDKGSLSRYRELLLGARQAIPAVLELFARNGVHATWATVGFLFCDGRDELLAALPAVLPEYNNPQLSPYTALDQLGASEADDPCHFAPSLIEQIITAPGQELGCHTFSHYYCREPGQIKDAFRADLIAAQAAAGRFGTTLQSLVLPRNQVEDSYLDMLPGLGIIAYRGCAPGWMYANASSPGDTLAARGARLLDAYANLSRTQADAPAAIASTLPVNIPASAFLRPYSPRLAWLDGLRLKRITAGMTHAARRGQVYHLWWHPHNMGLHLEPSLGFLEAILRHYARLRAEHGMKSMGLVELADAVMANAN